MRDLDALRQRKLALRKQVSAADYYKTHKIFSLMQKGQKLDMVEGLGAGELRRLLDMFEDIGFEEVQEFMKPAYEQLGEETSALLKQISEDPKDRMVRTDGSEWLRKFMVKKDNLYEKITGKIEDDMLRMRMGKKDY